jgi:hypothetical protein
MKISINSLLENYMNNFIQVTVKVTLDDNYLLQVGDFDVYTSKSGDILNVAPLGNQWDYLKNVPTETVTMEKTPSFFEIKRWLKSMGYTHTVEKTGHKVPSYCHQLRHDDGVEVVDICSFLTKTNKFICSTYNVYVY